MENLIVYEVCKPMRAMLKEPPYAVIDKEKYKKFSDSLVPKGYEQAVNVANKKMCLVYVMDDLIPNGMIQFTRECTWREIHDAITFEVRKTRYGKYGSLIQNVGLSYHPVYRVTRSKVVDPRRGTPFECLPDRAIIYISMLQRAEGWIPIAIGFDVCHSCGKMENENIVIKKCKNCRKAKYCSKTCQSRDWTLHRIKCLVSS